jgi:hypothetical protein
MKAKAEVVDLGRTAIRCCGLAGRTAALRDNTISLILWIEKPAPIRV